MLNASQLPAFLIDLCLTSFFLSHYDMHLAKKKKKRADFGTTNTLLYWVKISLLKQGHPKKKTKITDFNTKTERIMCESVQAETFPQLPYISASGGRRNMALAGEGLQKPTQPKMCRTNTSSFVTTSQQPPSSQNLSFTLKAISYFHTYTHTTETRTDNQLRQPFK